MTHDDTRPEFVRPTPVGKSPQRIIQRPRIPDTTWIPALTKAHAIDRPIGHVITELLDQWLAEDDRTTGPDQTGPDHGADDGTGPDHGTGEVR